MIRAAIIPGSWTALLVAKDVERGTVVDRGGLLVPLFAESFQVGELVPAESGPKPLHRVVSEFERETVVRRVVDRLQAMGVEEAAIEYATTKTSRWHEVSGAIRTGLEEVGITVSYVKRWRVWNTIQHREWVARRIAEGFYGWPGGDGRYEVCRNCGAMLLESLTRGRPYAPPDPKEIQHEPTGDGLVAQSPGASGGETPANEPSEARTKLDGPEANVSGPSLDDEPAIAGIDPGSGYLGVVIARGAIAPLKLVAKHVYPVGERVPLARARKIKRGDEVVIITTRHSLTEPMVDRLANQVLEFLLKHNVKRLALEHVDSVHLDVGQLGAASSIATSLIRAGWVEAVIGDRAAKAGIEVVRVAATSWRAVVAGRRKRGGAGAELIPEAIARGFANWPHETDAHERDAAGLCLWLVAPAPAPPPPREPRKKAEGKREREYDANATKPPSYYVRLERSRKETEEKRKAAGCTCANRRRGRHQAGCPLAHKNGELGAKSGASSTEGKSA